jgi:hypothetical protein
MNLLNLNLQALAVRVPKLRSKLFINLILRKLNLIQTIKYLLPLRKRKNILNKEINLKIKEGLQLVVAPSQGKIVAKKIRKQRLRIKQFKKKVMIVRAKQFTNLII